MDILEDIIGGLRDETVKEVRRGLHWTAVVSRSCGLASTLMRESCQDGQREGEPFGLLAGQPARELARLAASGEILNASLGLAAINSLIDVDLSRCADINAGDLLKEGGRGKNVSVIGHFPFTDELRKAAKNLWVMEKWQRPGDHPEADAETYLPRSDIVAISSTTLINHTLSGLLRLCPEKSLTVLLGPTTPMTEVLFSYGVDVISGSIVLDTELALTYISEGANFRQLKRTGAIRLITMTKTKITG
jgi:uncharacterized protein (DUF4213/DUF364 family)